MPQDVRDASFRVPAQSAPDELVHIVVAALRIAQKTNRERLSLAEDGRLGFWSRINALPRLGQRVGHVPIRHRVLALPRVRNIRVVANRIPGRDQLAQLLQANPHLGAEHHSAQPARLLALEDVNELLQPRLVKALRGDPNLCLGMVAVQVFGLLFQQGHQHLRLCVAGIATRHEDRINAA